MHEGNRIMGKNKETCVNCGNKSNVYYIEQLDDYFCEDCYSEEDVESDYNTEKGENQKEMDMSGLGCDD